MIKKLSVFILLLFAFNAVQSQSRVGFEHAGDDALEKQDPVSAIGFYNQAMNYEESAELYFKIGKAYKALNDYETSLKWFMQSLNKSGNDNKLSTIAVIESADLLKRLGRFTEAENLLQNKKNIPASDSLWFDATSKGVFYAEKLTNDSVYVQITNIGSEINSSYSDFAPVIIGDSILYFSSLRFPVKEKNKQVKYISRIQKSSINKNTFSKPELLPVSVDQPGKNTANASVSADGRLMIFTRCEENENNLLICTLYESQNNKGLWSNATALNDSVNLKGSTNTQPCIATNRAEGYVLYFSSDRKNGFGKNDIWISKRNAKGDYSSPQNAGAIINSANDELTPFYDVLTDTLYFSSDRNEGLGGFDILSAHFANGKTEQIIHPGPPLNSGYNDLYYSVSSSSSRQKLLVSNRPPSAKLNGNACCYDIYKVDDLPPPLLTLKTDSVVLKNVNSLPLSAIPLDSISVIPVASVLEKINELLPLRLYFDNDFPDPKTVNTSTISKYNELTLNYLQKLPEYKTNYATGNLSVEKEKEISSFFNDSINGNFKTLENFTAIIYKLLSNGSLLKLRLQGCASPLADSRYNVTLSMRRINSLRNYWLNWNNKMLLEYINSGKLLLVDDPAGENFAKQTVSDNAKDKAASVYSPSAARERRIEVTEISLQAK